MFEVYTLLTDAEATARTCMHTHDAPQSLPPLALCQHRKGVNGNHSFCATPRSTDMRCRAAASHFRTALSVRYLPTFGFLRVLVAYLAAGEYCDADGGSRPHIAHAGATCPGRGPALGGRVLSKHVFAFKEPTLRPHTLLNGSAHGPDSGATQVHLEAASTSPLAALAALQVLQWHAAHRGR